MAYEIYERKILRVSSPAITLNRRGRLVFNVAATEILDKAGVENVFLLWDGDRRRFAVRATNKKDHRTVKVRYAAKRKWAAISAKGFLEHIGHDTDKTTALAAKWDDQENQFEVEMPEQASPSDTLVVGGNRIIARRARTVRA
jgi:hypothetical protein